MRPLFPRGKKIKTTIAFPLMFLLFLLPALSEGNAVPAERASYSPDFSQGTWGCGLHLSVEQTERLRDLQNAFLEETRGVRDRLKQEEANLRGLWNRRNPDRKKISASRDEIRALNSDIRDRAKQYRLKADRVLSPGQQAQLGRFPQGYGEERLSFGMRGELASGRRDGTGYGSCPRL